MRIHPLWLVVGVVVLVGVGVGWNEMRRGYDDARVDRVAPAPAARVSEPVIPTSVQAAPVGESTPPVAEAADQPEIAAARAVVLERLKDPGSAQFRSERMLEDGATICLEVNAKNGFGGYTGFAQAVVITPPSGAAVAWVDDGQQGVAAAACEST